MMQPVKLYAGGKDEIPERIILGQTSNNQIVGLLPEELFCHILFRGQTSSGKTRALALVLMQLLAMGERVIFIDPLGAVYNLVLYWWSHMAREYYIRGQQEFEWFQSVLPQVLFWDLSNPNHPYRHNMLKPCESINESLSDVTARLLKFFNCLFSGDSSEGAMDTQLQRRENLVDMFVLFAATNSSLLMDGLTFLYDSGFRAGIISQAEQRSDLFEVRKAARHWQYLEASFRGAKFGDKINSTETGLSLFYENPSIRNFLLSGEQNVPDFADILNRRSLFIKAPVSDLATRKLLLQYLYTTFLDLADKRADDATPVFLGSDESALVFNSMLADYICRIRNKKVYLINSHQSLSQMLTPEGIKIAETIESQSILRFYFRHDYAEAEKVVDSTFCLTGKKPKLIEVTTTISKNAGETTGKSVSDSVSHEETMGIARNVQEGVSKTSTKSYSVSDSLSITEGMTQSWSEAEGLNEVESWNFQNAFTYSEAINKGLSQVQGGGVTFSIGRGKSLLKIETETGVVTIGESEGQTETTSTSSGYSEGQGTNESYSQATGRGSALNYSSSNGGQSITIVEGAPVSIGSTPAIGSPASETINQFKNVSLSNSQSKNKAWSDLSGIANSMSKAVNKSKSQGTTTGNTLGITQQEAASLAQQFSEAITHAKTYAKALQKAFSHTNALGKSSTHAHTIGESASHSIQRAIQQGESLAMAELHNHGISMTQTLGHGVSSSKQLSLSINTGFSISLSYRIIFYSLAEEKIMYAQEIRMLPQRTFYLSIAGSKNPIKVWTAHCYQLPTRYGQYDFAKIMVEFYKNLATLKDHKVGLFPSTYPSVPAKDIEIYPNISDEFAHFFPVDPVEHL